jgi:hypothetical protein
MEWLIEDWRLEGLQKVKEDQSSEAQEEKWQKMHNENQEAVKKAEGAIQTKRQPVGV